MPALQRDFFARPSPDLAQALIGTTLLVGGVGGIVVETEAYDRHDPASHAFRGPTTRNAPMFGPPGYSYVYLSYGIHWCLNVVCGTEPSGSAVLIRALQPVSGRDLMQRRRGTADPLLLCSGPGRLSQALAITGALNAMPMDRPPFSFESGAAASVVAGVRIGLSVGVDTPWRFCLSGSAFLSRKLRP